MTPETLEFFARNTGDFYAAHCEYARIGADEIRWHIHVTRTVLPRYRLEHSEPYEGLSRDEIALVVAALRAYYARKIKEGA